MPCYRNYLGIDYSGAGGPQQRLTGIRCFRASSGQEPIELLDDGAFWSRASLYQHLRRWISESGPLLIGVDHGFSFPYAYFEAHGLSSWREALDDFLKHWPTDRCSVQSLRSNCHDQKRQGDARWRRETEKRASAKSVFHFDVPGSVAKSTHAGLPWLLKLKMEFGSRLHVWPYDGLEPPAGVSVILETYPALWSGSLKDSVPLDLGPDQRDAFVVAKRLMHADEADLLKVWFDHPASRLPPQQIALEGWILGVD